ncbi:hypothetical protein AGLY_011658 [Aphis glycines]|uniref:Uncharacterized protein n=1 Tax=Aphis glycines TaxID=307491 RepID=A0A6G0TB00_APHGL|nr:hypothetical protein AGLY_011658 [Aphis glycines]
MDVLNLNPMVLGYIFHLVVKKVVYVFNGPNTPKCKFFYNYCTPNLWKILLTYEELCIKFLSILWSTRDQYRHVHAEDGEGHYLLFSLFSPLCAAVDKRMNRRCSKSDEFWSNSGTDLSCIGRSIDCWKILLLTSIMHQGYSLCHRKPPPNFEIEALFQPSYAVHKHKNKQNVPYITLIINHINMQAIGPYVFNMQYNHGYKFYVGMWLSTSHQSS